MKNFFKKLTPPLFLSLFAICLLMGINNAQAQNSGTNTGIWDTYIVIGAAPTTFFVDGAHLQYPNAVGFNALDLGIYAIGGTLNLAGGLDYTAKVSAHANVCSGKLYYSIYANGATPTTWDSVVLNYTNAYGNVTNPAIDSIVNQEWSATANTANILNGLAAGSYNIQIYFTSTGSDTTANGGTNCATVFTENNSGANYTATFTVAASPSTTLEGAGIWDTYVLIGASPNSSTTTTYFAGGTHLLDAAAPAFNGANLGTLTTIDTLNITGGNDFTYKNKDTGNVCGGVLYYSVYPSTGTPGEFSKVALNYNGTYGNTPVTVLGDSLVTQEWSNSANAANVLSGLTPGTYDIQIYFSSTGSTSNSGSCTQTFVEFGGGANYTATFTLTYPAGVTNITNDNIWQVYPNPVTSQLNISTGSGLTAKADKVELFDVLGRTILAATDVLANPIQIDMSSINAGTYFVRVTTENGSYVKTVVKQ